jgi:hypothetical protein
LCLFIVEVPSRLVIKAGSVLIAPAGLLHIGSL